MSRILEALNQVEESRDRDEAPEAGILGVQLTAKQQVAIRALLRTSTVEEAAAAAGIPDRTLRRWLSRPGFVAGYYAAGRLEIESSLRRLEKATEAAAAVLEQTREILRGLRESAKQRTGLSGSDGENGDTD